MTLPGVNAILTFGAFLACGMLVGLAFFSALRWTVQRLLRDTGALAVLALNLGRFALLAATLVWAARQGASPLLGMALGIVMARVLLLRASWNTTA